MIRAALPIATIAASSLAGDLPLTWRQGDSSLTLTGYSQFRYELNWRDAGEISDTPGMDGTRDVTQGFTLRRTRLTAQGESGAISFKLTASFSRNGGDADASDAYVETALADDLSLQVGQFKVPFLKEELTSAKRLLAADRSNTNSVYTLSRSQGVALRRERDRSRVSVMLHDGADGANVDWYESVADFALAARGEWLLVGDSFRPFREATSPRGTSASLMLGVAGDYESINHAPGFMPEESTDFDNVVSGTIDLDYKADGWGLMASGIVRHQWGGMADFTDFGLVAQGSAYVDEDLELFGRVDVVFADSDRSAHDPFPGITAGFTRYVLGHATKIVTDVQYFPVGTTENSLVGGNTGIGLLVSEGAQVVGRVQLQVIF